MLLTYMMGWLWNNTCHFFDNRDDCIEECDTDVFVLSNKQTTHDTKCILKYLINKKCKCKDNVIKTNSIRWYNSLSIDE